jgi:ElaB/YqjD/DUF883 family membrane-anchored ribosome-binding protein
VVAAALAVIVVSVMVLWNSHQWDYLPVRSPDRLDTDVRGQMLQDRIEILSRRAGDMEMLVTVLLALSGLYTIVFVVTSYLNAASFGKQADRSARMMKDEIGLAMGDLRSLQDETRQVLRNESKTASERLDAIHGETRKMVSETEGQLKQGFLTYSEIEINLHAIQQRLSALVGRRMSDEERLELIQYEQALAPLDAIGAKQLGSAMAPLYRLLGQHYADSDLPRSRFYLQRGLAMAPAGSQNLAENQYELARTYARMVTQAPAERTLYYNLAVEQLRAAFRHPSKNLEDSLAGDIEEGGVLYQLASTPPFDKAVNDLLLNVSVGMG